MNNNGGLFAKIFFRTTLGLAIVSIGMFISVIVLFPLSYISNMVEKNDDLVLQLINQLAVVKSEEEAEELLLYYENSFDISSIIVNTNNDVVLVTPFAESVTSDEVLNWEKDESNVSFSLNGTEYRYIIQENSVIYRDKSYTVQTYFEINKNQELLKPFFVMLPLILFCAILVAISTAYFISKMIIHPLKLLTEKSVSIAHLDFNNGIEWESDDEFGVLSEQLNIMQDRLQEVIKYMEEDSFINNQMKLEEQRQQIAILSHELNTPLTVLKMQTELIMERAVDDTSLLYLQRSLKKVDEIEGLVNQILDFKQSDDLEVVNVNTFIRELTATTYQHVLFKFDFQSDLTIQVPSIYLQRLVTNLVNNSVKYNYNNMPIQIQIKERRISITNAHDPSVIVNKQELVKPFVRANVDERIKGDGLGLHICTKICALQGYEFDLFSKDNNFTAAIEFDSKSVVVSTD